MNNTTSLTKLHHEMIELRERAEKAEAELQKMLEQKPVAYEDYWKSDGTGIVHRQKTSGRPLYAAPVATPATECRGIPGRGCQYLAACNTPCNKCGNVHNSRPDVRDLAIDAARGVK